MYGTILPFYCAPRWRYNANAGFLAAGEENGWHNNNWIWWWLWQRFHSVRGKCNVIYLCRFVFDRFRSQSGTLRWTVTIFWSHWKRTKSHSTLVMDIVVVVVKVVNSQIGKFIYSSLEYRRKNYRFSSSRRDKDESCCYEATVIARDAKYRDYKLN